MRLISATAIASMLACGTSKPRIDMQESSPERRTGYTNVLNVADLPAVEVSITPPYPNPFGFQPSIPFTLLIDGGVLIRILDIEGELITEAGECCLEAGEHSFYVTARDRLEVVFLYQVITAEKTETKMIRWPTGASRP